jgi:hypothetical protein
MDGWTGECTYVNMEPRSEKRVTTGRYRFEPRLHQGVRNWLKEWGALPRGVDPVISRVEILQSGRWLNPKVWDREIMEKLRSDPHSEPLTDTWTSDFLCREGEDREVVGLLSHEKCNVD